MGGMEDVRGVGAVEGLVYLYIYGSNGNLVRYGSFA